VYTFRIKNSKELEEKFINEAKEAGIIGIQPFFVYPGIRACIYNSMPIKGVEFFANFMMKFKQEN